MGTREITDRARKTGCQIHFRLNSESTAARPARIAIHRIAPAVDTWEIAVPHMSGFSVSDRGAPEASER